MKLQFIPNLWHTWEVSASCSQGISHWGHGQHNVEIVGTLVNKVLPDHFFNMRTTCSCSLLTNLIKVRKDTAIFHCFKKAKRILCNTYSCKVCKSLL